MNCKETNELLWQYLDDDLIPEKKQIVQLHLSQCSICQREFEILSSAIKIINNEKVKESQPFFVEKVMNNLSYNKKEYVDLVTYIKLIFTSIKPVYATVIVLFAIGLGIYLGLPNSTDTYHNEIESFVETYNIGFEEGILNID